MAKMSPQEFATNTNLERRFIEQYGLMDGNGNRIYMSYDKYLNAKKNLPLYLATAEAHLVGYPQAELLNRDINLAQKNDLSSKIGKNFYTGAEISNKRHKIWLAQIINSMVVSTFVKFIGDFAGGYGAFGDDDNDDNLLEHIAENWGDFMWISASSGSKLSFFHFLIIRRTKCYG